ncbi:hypothetical protein As57867_018823, partial [Aphanomyces stellatus]
MAPSRESICPRDAVDFPSHRSGMNAMRTPGKGSSAAGSLPANLVRQHGYLMKKSLFRGLKPLYFSVNFHSAKLYSFADYNDYSLWNSQGQLLVPEGKRDGPGPLRVYHVVAVDQDTTAGPWKLVLSIRKKAGSTKVDKMVLTAESSDEYNDWINAFHDVLQRGSRANSTVSCESASSRRTFTRGEDSRYKDPTTPPPHSSDSSPMSARTGSTSRQGSKRSLLSSEGSRTQPPSTHEKECHGISRDIVLIGCANGSIVGVSEAKLAQAKYELSQLLQEPGTQCPDRGLPMACDDYIDWLHGRPDFTLTDLAYLKGRSRWHDAQSMAARVETLLRVFVME